MNKAHWGTAITLSIVLIILVMLMVLHSCAERAEIRRVERVEVDALNKAMSEFVETHPIDSVYDVEALSEAYDIAKDIRIPQYIDKSILDNLIDKSILDAFNVVYSTISTECIGSSFEAWQASCASEEISIEQLASILQDAVGFDYNIELTSRQLTRLDFDILEESFAEVADPIKVTLDQLYSEQR